MPAVQLLLSSRTKLSSTIMGSANLVNMSHFEVAKRFLQTAVVVDDEALSNVGRGSAVPNEIVAPGRNAITSSQQTETQETGSIGNTLNSSAIMDSFARIGVICGVVDPSEPRIEMLKQADVIVLDWLLEDGDCQVTLSLLRDLLTNDVGQSPLRLIAIYTGANDLEGICHKITETLECIEVSSQENENKTEISFGHSLVVLYAKSDVHLPRGYEERSVSESELPERLLCDFAGMTKGLLPDIALTSLTAVREGTHKILDRFSSELDPAFLTHRICLPIPDDAENHIVKNISEELRGLMESAVSRDSPSGIGAVQAWLRTRLDDEDDFAIGNAKLSLDDSIELATYGLDQSHKKLQLKESSYKAFSAGFSGQSSVNFDEKLAWLMSSRTVFDNPPPSLWLGSIVSMQADKEDLHLVCLRPRCDCVRLDEDHSFLFLPLSCDKRGNEQLVIRVEENFLRVGVRFESDGWILKKFSPCTTRRMVVARRDDSNGVFIFDDVCSKSYIWRGELKIEYAQRLAQKFAEKLGRVAVDESEWLRRMALGGL